MIFGSGRDKVAEVQGKKPVIDHEKVWRKWILLSSIWLYSAWEERCPLWESCDGHGDEYCKLYCIRVAQHASDFFFFEWFDGLV